MDYCDLKLVETRLRTLEEKVLFSSSSNLKVTPSKSESNISCYDENHISYGEYRRYSALNVLRRHVTDFWNNISLPGFKYVGEPGRHRSDRYIWILVLFISLFVSAKYIEDAYKKWQGSPVLLSFNDSLTPISIIPFPAVTLCPGRRVGDESSLQDKYDTWNETDIKDVPQEDKDIMSAAGLLCPDSKYFQGENMSTSERYYNSSLHGAIDKVSVNCEDVIDWFKFNTAFYAEVNGNSSVCNGHFQTLYGDSSNVCFAFNMLPANDIFKKNVIPPVIDRTTLLMKPNWTPDHMLEIADLTSTVPRYTDSSGRWAGLYIGMDRFSANESGICGAVKTNTKMYFHHPAELPMSQIHEAVDLPQYKELYIRLHPKVVTASGELLEYSPINRRCYFSDERRLSLFKVYTQRNCQMECRVNCSLSLCDCVPISLPRINSSVSICGKEYRTSCSPFLITGILENRLSWYDIVFQFRDHMGARYKKFFENYERFNNNSGKKLTDAVLNSSYPNCICDCPAACTSLIYDIQKEEGPPLNKDISKTFTRVAVSFKELEVTSVLRKELIGLTDFIANSGGVLGVFTGFSFLALCELVYYLTLRLWSTIKHAWEDEDGCTGKGDGGKTGRGKRERLKCCFCFGPTVDDF